MIALDTRELELLAARLAPYARALLDRAAHSALQIHADEVGPEHLLSTLMEDEDCAAHRAAVHAFADPATVSDEARSISAGILISGSSAALPFSARGVLALRGARERAARRRDDLVLVPHLALSAFDQLEADLQELFSSAGWNPAGLEALLPEGGGGASEQGHLFRHFSDDAKRALSAAAKLARSGEARSISAAHLFQSTLAFEARLERACGMPASRARIALRGRLEDTSEVRGGPLAPDSALEAFLARIPERADSLDLLATLHTAASPELATILARHKITPALLARARGAFRDPE
jgi:ATP-dependent Clp protease ATP-binding subunit ClpA